MQKLFCLGNFRSVLKKSVLFIFLFLARKSSSRSSRAHQRQPCPCSIVIPDLFPSTSLVTQMFFWRPFPLCFLLFSVSSRWHPSVLNTSLEKDPLPWWQQSKLWFPSLVHLWTAFSAALKQPTWLGWWGHYCMSITMGCEPFTSTRNNSASMEQSK